MAQVNGTSGKHNVKNSVSLITCYDHKGAVKVNVKYGVRDFGGEKNIHPSSLSSCSTFCLRKSIMQLLNTIIKCLNCHLAIAFLQI